MAMELKAFYQEVETVFRDIWPVDNKHRSIICKTTGISVMIRMLGYIHQNVLSDDICQGLKEANTDIVPQYKKVVHDELMKLYYERHRLFGLNGSYSKTGGKGIEKSLYRDMCDILSAKVEDLAEDTLSALKIWLSMYPDSGQPLDNEHYNLFITKAKANGDKITGYILAEVLKQVQPSWNPQKVSVFVAQEIERININL